MGSVNLGWLLHWTQQGMHPADHSTGVLICSLTTLERRGGWEGGREKAGRQRTVVDTVGFHLSWHMLVQSQEAGFLGSRCLVLQAYVLRNMAPVSDDTCSGPQRKASCFIWVQPETTATSAKDK